MTKKSRKPFIVVRVYRPSGFLSGATLSRHDMMTLPAPHRVARRYFAGQRAGLQVVRALPDGAAFVDVVDSMGRQLAAWKPCSGGRYTGTHDAPPAAHACMGARRKMERA